jgi:hypothetical protein
VGTSWRPDGPVELIMTGPRAISGTYGILGLPQNQDGSPLPIGSPSLNFGPKRTLASRVGRVVGVQERAVTGIPVRKTT